MIGQFVLKNDRGEFIGQTGEAVRLTSNLKHVLYWDTAEEAEKFRQTIKQRDLLSVHQLVSIQTTHVVAPSNAPSNVMPKFLAAPALV